MDNIAIEQEQQPTVNKESRQAYSLRIKELRGYALEDEIKVNPTSEQDFWGFVESLPLVKRPRLCSAITAIIEPCGRMTTGDTLEFSSSASSKRSS